MGVRLGTVVVACLAVGSACSSGQRTTGEQQAAPTSSEAAPSTTKASTTTERRTTTTRPTTTTSTTTTTTTLPPTTTSTLPPTTTTTVLPVYDPACVVLVAPGDTLTAIVERRSDAALTIEAVQMENAIADPTTLSADIYLDLCVGNNVDDITGQQRVSPTTTTAPPPGALASGVQAQQQKLNELFYGLGLPGLAVDGDSGRLTEQQLCAARMALNLPVSRADMEPGGADEQALMAATSLSIPAGAPTWAGRWVLIDRTCQVMFVGEGSNRIVFMFQTSTGEPGYETRDQNGSAVFRYRSASGNGGWHNSYDYPVGEDNPLNGNMYRPLYFDDGQAIHGANNVPTSPASKGCARLRVDNQNLLIDWLGLGGVTDSIADPDRIGLVVSVQGDYY